MVASLNRGTAQHKAIVLSARLDLLCAVNTRLLHSPLAEIYQTALCTRRRDLEEPHVIYAPASAARLAYQDQAQDGGFSLVGAIAISGS